MTKLLIDEDGPPWSKSLKLVVFVCCLLAASMCLGRTSFDLIGSSSIDLGAGSSGIIASSAQRPSNAQLMPPHSGVQDSSVQNAGADLPSHLAKKEMEVWLCNCVDSTMLGKAGHLSASKSTPLLRPSTARVGFPVSNRLGARGSSADRVRASSQHAGENDGMFMRAPDKSDIQRMADFLSYSMFDLEPSESTSFFTKLQCGVFSSRFAGGLNFLFEETVGKVRAKVKEKLPCAISLTKEDDEIIASVQLDTWVLDNRTKQMRVLPRRDMDAYGDDLLAVLERYGQEIVPMLSNLAVRKDKRGQGLARKLLAASEEQVKAWGFPIVYLFVDLYNTKALKLYESCGYKVITQEKPDLRMIPGKYFFRSEKRVILTMSKQLSDSSP
eukprot:gnl/TRDRNA2_/TRDRNA2_168982_c0_seq1.p1 gnl/TRDRNA2_/TRDRNA2_168982_c0~~gnl/TRDRNA2_/TRDRNA2_168982_c0_seq1.p1  ORF type:complete len:384 (-),score=62.69 gnl/TRDRNA2_/TRDRNA2_168982_c0_seq1:92-1243(-)